MGSDLSTPPLPLTGHQGRPHARAIPWDFLAILTLALLLRSLGLTTWSLWEDEEGSVFLAHNLHRNFGRSFPLFFYLLQAVFEITGISVAAGRCLAAAIGMLGLGLFYAWGQRLISRPVALLATAFLAVNFSHLFWSQSIRYYHLVVVFQTLTMWAFFVGFENRRYGWIFLSHGFFILAMLSHFSAMLLAPALVGYLMLMGVFRVREGAYNVWGYLAYLVPLGVILAAFAAALKRMQGEIGGMTIASARDPLHVLLTAMAYFGPPIVGLALGAPWLAPRSLPRRVLIFVLCITFIPMMELAVIAKLNTTNVTYYYALFSLLGFALLASLTLIGLYERGWRRLSVGAGLLTMATYLLLLGGYYTTMYGDRPRWEEAALYLRDTVGIRLTPETESPEVYSTVPYVVHHYLVGPRREGPRGFLVQWIKTEPPGDNPPTVDTWYVVEVGHATPQFEHWLKQCCHEAARFEAHTGPRDRTVVVYHYPVGSKDPQK